MTTPSGATAPTRLGTVAIAGGSIGGLLAAAAAAPYATRVVIAERDTLPAGPETRPGTPQATHAHGLLASGRHAIEELLPGTSAELIEHGGVSRGDIGVTGRWWIGGGLLTDAEIGLTGLTVSRVLLESVLRRRVAALPNVELRDGTDVTGLLADPGRRRVTGLRLVTRASGAAEDLAADLVIDATGRAARAERWFAEYGWVPAATERVPVGVRYATTHIAADPQDLGGRAVVVSGATPEVPRGAALLRQEGQTYILMLFGYAEDQPPLDPDGFRAFARTIVSPDVAPLLATRELLEPPRSYRFPDCRRHRVEDAVLPRGYVAIGDAICSFDPTFGQGMSVAALQAVALRDTLAAGGSPADYHRAAAVVVDRAWMVVTGAVRQIPALGAHPGLAENLIARYIRRAQRAARRDPVVAAQFMRVMNLLADPQSMMHPPIARRVLARGGTRPGPARAQATTRTREPV